MSLILPEYLWKHQKKIITETHDRQHYGYFLEQGTGKTLTGITQFRNTFQKYRRPMKTLIICPNIVVLNWQEEIEKFSKCGPMVQPLTGPGKKRIEALKTPGKHIFITNFEALDIPGLFFTRTIREVRNKKTGKVKKEKIDTPIDHGFEWLIVDESHRFKTHSATRTKLAIKMADKIPFKRILTGTPILKDEQDIWAQYRILDGGTTFGTNFYAFRNEWFIDKNAGMPGQRHFPAWELRPGMEEKMNRLIYNKAVRVEKRECLDLPPLVMQRAFCEMGRDQKKAYEDMKRDFIAYLDDDAATASVAITKALRLQQIVSGYFPAEAKMKIGTDNKPFKDVPRLKALTELLEDRAKGRKTIVWAVFKPNYEMVAGVCEKLGLAAGFLTGLQSKKEKDQAVKDFNEGDTDVLIASPAAGGTGVNLTSSDLSIWYSRDFSLGNRLQSLARNHRGGSEQHESITNVDILCQGTIDELGLAALDRKESIAEKILSLRL